MKIAISGGGGFIGRSLTAFFRERGMEVLLIPRAGFTQSTAELAHMLEGADIIIHLSGAPVVGRWTASYRRNIYSSRVDTTNKLASAIGMLKHKPAMFLCASAVGIYPETGVYTESTTRIADGFLGTVCRDWELAAKMAEPHTRVSMLRFGTVLGRGGGALQTMMLPFRFGLGGKIGHGRQMMSWVHIDDLVRAVGFIIEKRSLTGPVNITSPRPVSNSEFTHVLARVMKRPALFTVPVFMLKMLYGEGASVVASGQTVYPERLRAHGFQFAQPGLEGALRDILKKHA